MVLKVTFAMGNFQSISCKVHCSLAWLAGRQY